MRPSHNSVVAVLKRRQGNDRDVEVLLLKCLPIPNRPEDEVFYKLPGGKGISKESPEDTARREIKHETGLKIPKKAALHSLTTVTIRHHTKHGFWVDRDECKGALQKSPHDDRSTRIVGRVWVPISKALTLIPSTEEHSSHHDLLCEVKTDVLTQSE